VPASTPPAPSTAATPAAKPGAFRRLGAAGPFAIILSFWPPLGSFILFAVLTTLGPWLRSHADLGVLIYFVFTATLVGVSFLPTYSAAILAGWAFGFGVGLPVAMAAITVASVIAYAIGRWIARDRVLDVISEKPRWHAVQRALLGSDSARTFFVVTLLRVPPFSPFAIVNFALAAARVPLRHYIFGTLIGIAPRTAAAAYAAARLEQLRFDNVSERWTVVAGIVVTLIACSILGYLANRALRTMSAPAK
jgi:uncharacterized membrane protein YdjX (TVP38/TMEM64 family)